MSNIANDILNVIESIQPLDDLETLHVKDASNWIRTTTDSIFRISKPDNPDFDRREMNGYRWYTFDAVLKTDIDTLAPHMHRFVNKLQRRLKA